MDSSGPSQHAAAYFPNSVATPQSYPSERHHCMMCRTDFTDKTEFIIHVRSHFDPHQQAVGQLASAKQLNGGDAMTAELIARGLVDASSLCS